MSIKEAFLKANIQAIIAIMVIILGFYTLAFHDSTSDVKMAVVGLMSMVVGYYFGSSSGSKDKQKTINEMKNK